MEKKTRIAWLDMAKGYGILLVVFAHLCEILLNIGVTAILPIYQWVYSFHMPLFFALSGYVFSAKEPPLRFLIKKAKSFLLPYLFLGFPMPIIMIVQSCQAGTLTTYSFIGTFKQFLLQERLWTLWFLTCLFCLNVLFYLCIKLLKTTSRLLVSSIVFPCLGLVYFKVLHRVEFPWNADVSLMAYPFFFAGYWCKLNRERIEQFLQEKGKYTIVAAAIIVNLLFSFISTKISGEWLDMYLNQYGIPLLVYPAAFAGIVYMVAFSKWFTAKPILYIGQNSLLYFAWHQTIVMPVFRWLIPETVFLTHIPNEWIASFLWVLIQLLLVVGSLTILNHLILHSKLKFILGK